MLSLLILGKGDTDYTDRNPRRLYKYAKEKGFDVQRIDYHEIEKLKPFKNNVINVMLFFPYKFWDENCEIPQDTDLYGTSKKAYENFKNFFLDIERKLYEKFPNYKLNFVTNPKNAAIDRDKIETIKRLRKHGIKTTEIIESKKLGDILEEITEERGIFIKCRYGAEGKGITILRKGEWKTNYKVEKERLTNYGIYEKWQFTDITGKTELLEQLLSHEIIIEKELLPPSVNEPAELKNKKFDNRVYVVNGEAPYFFIRANEIKREITNYSQGAKIIHNPEKIMPKHYVKNLKELAIKAAKALNLKFVGIDIMSDGALENLVVVEAQTFTDFPSIDKFNLGKYIINNPKALFI